jgi:hypothetical protein
VRFITSTSVAVQSHFELISTCRPSHIVGYPQVKRLLAPSQSRNAEVNEVDDDEGGEVIRRSDLSHEVPTRRAEVYPHLEKATVKASKDGIEVSTESYPGSPQNKAVTTLCLAAAIGVIAGIASISLAPIFALTIGVGTVVGLYLMVHFLHGHRTR